MAMESAIKHLIWNAYHHGDGIIQIKIKLTNAGEKVTITFCDEGSGIDNDKIEESLKPYKYGNRQNATKKEFRGAGLGLTIAADVIADHGGELLIENIQNEDGSRAGFRVHVGLPITQEKRKNQDKKINNKGFRN